MTQNSINIDLGTLSVGRHIFEYQLDDVFFKGLDQGEILGGCCAAKVEMLARETSFSLHFTITGSVVVTCDRCLDPVEIHLEPINDSCLIKLAEEDGEDDEAVYVNEQHPIFNLGWMMYEMIAVSLPVVHTHEAGKCNPEMERILQAHLAEDGE